MDGAFSIVSNKNCVMGRPGFVELETEAGAKGSMCRAQAEGPGGEQRRPASGHPKAEERTAGFSKREW